ncbi:MAG TPA: DHA2 family efflux MFS transporter permease subunit [Micromonosporaceae bacterium]
MPDRARPATVVLASLAFLMVTLDSLVVVTALPSIHTSLGGGTGGLQWIVNAYNLTFAVGIVTGAALGDRFGRRRLFMIGLASFVLASAACALAPTLGWLIAFRALQGLGGAILAPVGLALITEAFPPSRRGAAIGLWGGIAGLGVAAGPLVGGAVTQGLDWHWIFWVNVPVGLIALVGCAATLRESRGVRRPLDLPGMVLVALGLAALVDAVVEAPARGWSAPRTLALLVVGAVALAGFVAWERYATAPMIPLRLLRVRAFAAANVANMFSSAATFSAAYVMSQYFQLGRGDSPLGTGLRFLPWTARPLIVAPLAGVWCDRIGARRLAVPGLVMQAAGFAAIVALAGTAQPWVAYVGPFVVAGIGVSLALPTLPTAALSVVAPAEIGVAAGVVNTVQRIGPVIGIAVISAVFGAHGSLTSASEVTSGFRWALGTSALLSLTGAAVASILGRRRTTVEG